MLGLNNFARIQEIALSASLAVVPVSLAVCSWFPLLLKIANALPPKICAQVVDFQLSLRYKQEQHHCGHSL